MNSAHVSHPSVRVKGTENTYEPTSCTDQKCTKAWPHMHCPLCVKTEFFQDPVILKAHYRVKHVDKGIEFAGLKILRCCEHCDIIGAIKGTKEFKGAHWHCYKCRNGFTRRDEAVKHYRTHFRNPSTTFQIQVSQDINQTSELRSKEASKAVEGLPQNVTLIETVVSTMGTTEVNAVDIEEVGDDSVRGPSGEIQVSVAANETVGSCDGQTIMIVPSVQSDDVLRNLESGDVVHTIQTQQDLQEFLQQQKAVTLEESSTVTTPQSKAVTPSSSSTGVHWRREKNQLQQQIRELQSQISQVTEEKSQMECNLKNEISNLKQQKRELELLNQLKIPLGDRLGDLLTELKHQHEDLLHQQLAQLRQEYLQQQLSEELDSQAAVAADSATLRVDVASLVQDTPPAHMMADPNTSQVVLSEDSYASLPISATGTLVLPTQSLIATDATSKQLFVVSHEDAAVIKKEAGENSDLEQVYEEQGTQHVVQEMDCTDLSQKIIFMNASNTETVEYRDGVEDGVGHHPEQLEVSVEDGSGLDTLAPPQTHKRSLDEMEGGDSTAHITQKQRTEL